MRYSLESGLMIQACFINSNEPPVSVTHICWFALKSRDEGGDFYRLYEEVEEKFPHPDAPNDAFIFQRRHYFRETVRPNDEKAPPVIMLYLAQKNCSLAFEQSK